MDFKKGSQYSRDDIHNLYFGVPVPDLKDGTGTWLTGYVNPKGTNEVIVFMNIDIIGKTGHDYPNKYYSDEKKIVWYGKSKSNSKQVIFKKIFNNEFTAHYFARWDNRQKYFVYLGIGKNFSFKDGHPTYTKNGVPTTCIEVTLNCDDSDQILTTNTTRDAGEVNFAMEKHLEEFLVENWNSLDIGKEFDRHEAQIEGKRKKYRTDTGEIDIFALSKDKKTYLVVELKKGRASDKVVGQIQRYMGYIRSEIANENQEVKGLIIGLSDDLGLKRAISINPDIQFTKYQISFDLIKD